MHFRSNISIAKFYWTIICNHLHNIFWTLLFLMLILLLSDTFYSLNRRRPISTNFLIARDFDFKLVNYILEKKISSNRLLFLSLVRTSSWEPCTPGIDFMYYGNMRRSSLWIMKNQSNFSISIPISYKVRLYNKKSRRASLTV